MISINLLPDTKSEYIRIRNIKRWASFYAVIVIAVVVLVSISLHLDIAGKRNQSQILQDDISKRVQEIQAVDTNTILTIQNQRNQLESLHEGKNKAFYLHEYLLENKPSFASFTDIQFTLDEETSQSDKPYSFNISGNAYLTDLPGHSNPTDSQILRHNGRVVLYIYEKLGYKSCLTGDAREDIESGLDDEGRTFATSDGGSIPLKPGPFTLTHSSLETPGQTVIKFSFGGTYDPVLLNKEFREQFEEDKIGFHLPLGPFNPSDLEQPDSCLTRPQEEVIQQPAAEGGS